MNTKDEPKGTGAASSYPEIPIEMQPDFQEDEVDHALALLTRETRRNGITHSEPGGFDGVIRDLPRSAALNDAFRQELERFKRREGIYSPALDKLFGDGEPEHQGDSFARFVQICGAWGLLDLESDEPAGGTEILAREEVSGDSEDLERELGLPAGALKNGSPEHGLLSLEERLTWLRSYVRIVIEEEQQEEKADFAADEDSYAGEPWEDWLSGPVCPLTPGWRPARRGTSRESGLLHLKKPLPEGQAIFPGRSSLAFAPQTCFVPEPAPYQVVQGESLTGFSPIRGLLRSEGTATWLSGMFRLDGPFADSAGARPTCITVLWHLRPHWDSFLSLAAEEMMVYLLDGEMEWEDAGSGAPVRLQARSGNNVLWTSSALPCNGGNCLNPFRARQLGKGEAVAIVVLYSSAGLEFETARDGRQVWLSTEEWNGQRTPLCAPRPPFVTGIPWNARELEALLSNTQALRGDRHDPARRAGQFVDCDLPGWSRLRGIDANLQVRLAKFCSPVARSRDVLMTEHAGVEIVIPLLGAVEFFCVSLESLRGSRLEKSTWRLSDFRPDDRISTLAKSTEISKAKFPDLLFLRSRYPHALQGGPDRDSVCLHVRCLSRY